jgi:hypothetical protein
MRRVLVAAIGAFMVVLAGVPTAATAGPKPIVQHFRFESEPFFLDLSDPSGSAQCDVQAVGYDTGVVTTLRFVDENGEVTRDVLLQSLATILTNPENGKVLEIQRSTIGFDASFTWNPDGSLTIVEKTHGLNLLYQGERVLTMAGHSVTTVLVRFNKKGDVVSVDIVESFTPHMQHAFPFLCEMLA